MADGYARATGKAGVVLVTSGPGATNAITGIATAFMDSIPMVVISGQVPSTMVGTDAFQETDMIGISRPIVKHSFMIKHPSEIPEVMKKAFYLAESGRPGPVVIDIPKDMTNPAEKFEYVYPKKAKLRSYSPAVRGHSGQIRKAAELLLGQASDHLRRWRRDPRQGLGTTDRAGEDAQPAGDQYADGLGLLSGQRPPVRRHARHARQLHRQPGDASLRCDSGGRRAFR